MLNREGFEIGRRHVGRPIQRLRIDALYRKRNASKKHSGAKFYPCMLGVLKSDQRAKADPLTVFPTACAIVDRAIPIRCARTERLQWGVSARKSLCSRATSSKQDRAPQLADDNRA